MLSNEMGLKGWHLSHFGVDVNKQFGDSGILRYPHVHTTSKLSLSHYFVRQSATSPSFPSSF